VPADSLLTIRSKRQAAAMSASLSQMTKSSGPDGQSLAVPFGQLQQCDHVARARLLLTTSGHAEPVSGEDAERRDKAGVGPPAGLCPRTSSVAA
jgi:hypothetical protein